MLNRIPQAPGSGHGRTDIAESLRQAYLQFRLVFVQSLRNAGVSSDSGTAISNRLQLTRQLSWQLSSIIAEPDVAKGLASLPGTRGLKLLADAVKSGAPDCHAPLVEAITRLESEIGRHAGDRARLDLLTAAWGHDGLDHRSEVLRREAFRVQSALFGINAACQVRGVIIGPSHLKQHNKQSLASYSYFADMVRYRNDRPARLFFSDIPWKGAGEPAIDVRDMKMHVEQMYQFRPEFSSATNEQPEITVQGRRGWVALAPGPLGCSQAVSIAFTGLSNYQYSRYADPTDPSGDIAQTIQFCFVPSEQYIVDFLTTPEIAEECQLEEHLNVACFDATGGIPMVPATEHDPAFLYNLDSRRAITPDTFDIDPASSTLSDLIQESARGIGLAVSDLVGLRYTTKYAMASTLTVVTRRSPEQS